MAPWRPLPPPRVSGTPPSPPPPATFNTKRGGTYALLSASGKYCYSTPDGSLECDASKVPPTPYYETRASFCMDPDVATFDHYSTTTFDGETRRYVSGTIAEAKVACGQSNTCRGFTYRDADKMYMLARTVGSAVAALGHTCYSKESPYIKTPSQYCTSSARSGEGSADIGTPQRFGTLAQAKTACNQNVNCTGFTYGKLFSPYNDVGYVLKRTVDGTVPDSAFDCYRKPMSDNSPAMFVGCYAGTDGVAHNWVHARRAIDQATLSIAQAQDICAGYQYFGLECPRDGVVELWCMQSLGGRLEAEQCLGVLAANAHNAIGQTTQSHTPVDSNLQCTGSYQWYPPDRPASWIGQPAGGMSRTAVYHVPKADPVPYLGCFSVNGRESLGWFWASSNEPANPSLARTRQLCQGYAYFALVCPNAGKVNVFCLNELSAELDKQECTGTPLTDLGNGRDNGVCSGNIAHSAADRFSWKPQDAPPASGWPLGGWQRAAVYYTAVPQTEKPSPYAFTFRPLESGEMAIKSSGEEKSTWCGQGTKQTFRITAGTYENHQKAAACREFGDDFVTAEIRSQYDQDLVTLALLKTPSSAQTFWLGAYDHKDGLGFVWDSDRARVDMTYKNWADGEGGARWVQYGMCIGKSLPEFPKWHDANTDEKKNVICMKNPYNYVYNAAGDDTVCNRVSGLKWQEVGDPLPAAIAGQSVVSSVRPSTGRLVMNPALTWALDGRVHSKADMASHGYNFETISGMPSDLRIDDYVGAGDERWAYRNTAATGTARELRNSFAHSRRYFKPAPTTEISDAQKWVVTPFGDAYWRGPGYVTINNAASNKPFKAGASDLTFKLVPFKPELAVGSQFFRGTSSIKYIGCFNSRSTFASVYKGVASGHSTLSDAKRMCAQFTHVAIECPEVNGVHVRCVNDHSYTTFHGYQLGNEECIGVPKLGTGGFFENKDSCPGLDGTQGRGAYLWHGLPAGGWHRSAVYEV